MAEKQCVACGQAFDPKPHVANQTYCSSPDCQRARRQNWQRNKLQDDPHYRQNQQSAQQAWSQRNPDYWRRYRETHPEYVDRNRARQHARDEKTTGGHLAKMDASR